MGVSEDAKSITRLGKNQIMILFQLCKLLKEKLLHNDYLQSTFHFKECVEEFSTRPSMTT